MAIGLPVYQKLVSTLDPDHQQLLLRFFLLFSRFEYAIKRTGQFARSRHGSYQPDWDAFKQSARESLDGREWPQNIRDILEDLKLSPVYKQTGLNSHSPIEHDAFEHDLDFLIESLKTIRNNLFHGTKQSSANAINITRDVWLFEHCLSILDFLVTINPEVKRHFEVSDDE